MASSPIFRGSITALVTPFKNGKLDKDAFAALVNRQVEAGSHGVVPVGTTGESPTVTHEEHIEIIKDCVSIVEGRIPVIAGAGSNSTAEAVHIAKEAEQAGADGLLCVTGYYNKPSQQGIVRHFEALDAETSLPIIVYNIPGRTMSDIAVETMAQLSNIESVVGVKDATGDLSRVARQRIECRQGFAQLSGEDMTAVGFNAMGGVGCISVTSNVAPELCAKMQNACLSGDWETALACQDKLAPLHDALFSYPSPAPVKYALSRLGLCGEEIRLPMLEAPAEVRAQVDKALEKLELV